MKQIVILGLLACTGCLSSRPCASTGWNFSVGTPATVLAPALVNQTPGQFGMASIAAGPIAAPPVAALASCTPAGPPSLGAVLADGRDPCLSLQDVCRRLDRIESRLPAEPLAAPRALPRGTP